jgi:radical SAM protein with 4Fe4S-binding SPASM domain
MPGIQVEATSSGRVLNNSRINIDDVFVQKFGQKWMDYRKAWAEASQKGTPTEFPLFVRFEAQFKCNSRCVMCVHGHPDLAADYRYKEYMPLETYKRLVDECASYGCPSIGVSQTNEPLLDPDLLERIRYATDKGIMDIHLNTNGMLLSEEISRQILDTGVTRLCVSLDAVTEETYKKIRRGLNFQTVKQNIEKFLELRNAKGQRLPALRVSFLLQDLNKHELEAFKEYWVDKADYVSVQRYVPISPFDDAWGHAIAEAPVRGEQQCSYPWESLFVHGDGTVVPCAAHRARHIAVGNINQKSLHEIWHSPEIEELRRALREGDLASTKLCSTCLY